MSEPTERSGAEAPEQGLDEGVVVSGDAGAVAGVGPQEALDELERDRQQGEAGDPAP